MIILDITLGEVVNSKAGRDRGKKFIIIDVIDSSYVLLSDGDLRRIEKPKKKKIRHIKPTGVVIESLKEKIEKKQKLTNVEIRKILIEHDNKPEGNNGDF